MEKRLILALFLSMIVIFIWTTFFAKKPEEESRELAAPTHGAVVRDEAPAAPPRAEVAAASPKEGLPLPPEKTVRLESEEMTVELSDVGATIRRLILKKSGVVKKDSYDLVEETLPEFRPLALRASARLKYDVEESSERGVTYKARTEGGVEITKRIELSDEPYVITMNLVLKNPAGEPLPAGEADVVCGTVFGLKEGRYQSLAVDFLVGDKVKRLKVGKIAKLRGEIGVEPDEVPWAAARNSFFTLILIVPDELSRNVFYGIYPTPEDSPRKNVMIGLGLKSPSAGSVGSYSLRLYAGPKDYGTLKKMGMKLDEVMGFFWLLKPLIIIILRSLKFFYAICGNYGVAIILLTIAIRIVLFPLNQKSFKSMKKMQDLAPLLEPLKQKYKNEPKKLQAETMALYKKHGVNPMSGCFPLLLQMPILISFFQTLRSSVELWGAHFLWIRDLSEPDRIYVLPQSLPIIGNNINLLPILMLVVFVLQQKMTPKPMGGGAQAEQQQKMMGMMMPIIFGVLFYNMPSGLVLYFTVSTLLGILQQWLVRREKPSAK